MTGINGGQVDGVRWGLPVEEVRNLAERLRGFWERFRACFQSKTRDTSEYGYHYLSGLLRMETDRNFANIGRKTGVAEQNMHHFMSNSPWSAEEVMRQIQDEIASRPISFTSL